VTLGSGVFAVQTPAADADNVYWIDGIAGRVVSMPISGGPLTTIWAGTSTRGPSALALVGTSLYWTVSSSTPDGGAIVRATTDGQSVVTLVSGLSAPRGLAISGQSVVFVDIGTDVVGSVTPR
jgi:hypothetical protein